MKKVLFAIIISTISAVGVSAQSNALLLGTTYIPQKNALNPAFYPSGNTMYIALPGFNPEFHIPLAFNDFLQYSDSKKSYYIDFVHMGDELMKDNNMFINTGIDLVGLGMRFGKIHATFSARTNMNIHLGIPTELVTVFRNGFAGTANSTQTIVSDNIVQATAYNEFAFGGGYSFGDFTVGARLKLLNGICDFRSNDTRLDITYDESGKMSQAIVDYNITATGTQLFRQKGMGDAVSALFSGKNWGYALDLGATYRWKMFEFSAALLDLGKGIHWKNDILTLTPDNPARITFDNHDFSHIEVENLDSIRRIFDIIVDSIEHCDSTSGTGYWTSIPTRLNLGATVQLGKMFRAGVLFHGQWDKDINFFDRSGNAKEKNMFRHTTTLVGAVNLANWVELMASLSVVKNGSRADWFNPGVGVNFSFGKIIQIYALANYVSSLNYKKMKSANVQIGFNLMFGKGLSAKATDNDD